MSVDLTETACHRGARRRGLGLDLGAPFAFAVQSFAAPVSHDAVLKVAWEGDDESLHDAEAFAAWNGRGAVRVLRRDQERRALLLERARPGTDISDLDDDERRDRHRCRRTAVAAGRAPFRPVEPEVRRWLARAEREGSELVPLARQLVAEVGAGRTGSSTGTFTTTTSFATASGSSPSTRSPTSPIASTTCPRSSGIRSAAAWTTDEDRARIAAFVARASTTSGSVRGP